MSNSENPLEPDFVDEMRRRFLQEVFMRMEGRLNRDSATDMQMFNELFEELLEEEQNVLSRAEKQRLYNTLLAAF